MCASSQQQWCRWIMAFKIDFNHKCRRCHALNIVTTTSMTSLNQNHNEADEWEILNSNWMVPLSLSLWWILFCSQRCEDIRQKNHLFSNSLAPHFLSQRMAEQRKELFLCVQSSLSIFSHKYLHKWKETFFILQNISIFALTKIVLEQRYLEMIAP